IGKMVELNNSEYWLPEVSNTFHGRDILSPVAAQLSLGLEPERFGTAVREMELLDWPQPQRRENRIDGAVQWIDRFGNLISNIPASLLDAGAGVSTGGSTDRTDERLKIECAGRMISGTVRSYGQRKPGELVALVGSGGFLEIAIVDGSAAATLHVPIGAAVVVEW
ncbi:MAG TPA: SAM-dependent chlorinase/fluorinase, partial [Pirellulales bacterium]